MTQEEIDNLQVGDIYERVDLKEIRIIFAISNNRISYKINGYAPPGSWNYKSQLLDPDYRLIGKANNMDTFEIKPGMVLITAESRTEASNDDTYITFLDGTGKIGAINFGGKGWVTISPNNMHVGCHKIRYVLDSPRACIRDGKVLWKRQEIKEMTVAEIEQKLGMQAGTLRIKK